MNRIYWASDRLCRILIAVVIGSISPSAVAQRHSNPMTYVSPSCQYELFVDHSAMDGSGPANYRLSRDGEEVWAGERPFSLWDAEVSDNGTVAGYAYEEGVQVGGNHGTEYDGLSIIIIAPDGQQLRREPADQHQSKVAINSWSGSDSSHVSGILVDSPTDRYIVRVPLDRMGDGPPLVWWTYRLSNGERLGDIIPEYPHPTREGELNKLSFQKDLFAEIVPGTPLVLMHWYTYGYVGEKRTQGAAVTLLDAGGKQIWALDLPGEYDGLGERWSWYWDLIEAGIQQVSVTTNGFAFQSYSLASRLEFTVHPDPESESGWRVVEAGRAEGGPPPAGEGTTAPRVELIELEQAGVIELESSGAGEGAAIGGISDFAIDSDGNLGFVRSDGNGGSKFIRVTSSGEVLNELPLDLPAEEEATLPEASPVSPGRWVLTRTTYSDGRGGARAWWLDDSTGRIEPIEGFTAGSIESLVRTGDGGFLVHSKHHLEYTIRDEVSRFDAQGQQLWSRLEEGYGHGFNFQAVTWIEGAGVAALTAVKNTIEFFDPAGKHLRSASVTELIGAWPNYPSGLVADLRGGLMLHDFNGEPPIYRLDAEGKVGAKFHPRFPDGRTFGLYGDVQVAPDGTLWTSDHHALLRLDENGVVVQVIGPSPDDDRLEGIRAMTVDRDGHIYAVNERTAAVHVFDSRGKLLRVCKPLPTDFPTDGGGIGSMTVDGDGRVFYETGAMSWPNNPGYLGFTPTCERLGFERLVGDGIREEWLFKPGTRERWALGYEAIYLVGADGTVTKRIGRRPDEDWLQNVGPGAVGPDGSLAVISSPQGLGARGPHMLNIYGPNGEPRQTMPLISDVGYGPLAFNGSTIIVSNGESIDLYSLDGRAPRRFVPAAPQGEVYWYPFVSPDGTEVWLRASNSMTLLRYRVPV